MTASPVFESENIRYEIGSGETRTGQRISFPKIHFPYETWGQRTINEEEPNAAACCFKDMQIHGTNWLMGDGFTKTWEKKLLIISLNKLRSTNKRLVPRICQSSWTHTPSGILALPTRSMTFKSFSIFKNRCKTIHSKDRFTWMDLNGTRHANKLPLISSKVSNPTRLYPSFLSTMPLLAPQSTSHWRKDWPATPPSDKLRFGI